DDQVVGHAGVVMVVAQTETANHECETKAHQGCRSRARPGQDYRIANTTCMTPLELDLDMLRERHLFPQDCPQLGVERGGVEGAGDMRMQSRRSRKIVVLAARAFPKGRPPMRLVTFILSSGIALTWIPACASAQSNTSSQPSVSTIICPKHEGYPDCGHDGLAGSTAPAPSQRRRLWQPLAA